MKPMKKNKGGKGKAAAPAKGGSTTVDGYLSALAPDKRAAWKSSSRSAWIR